MRRAGNSGYMQRQSVFNHFILKEKHDTGHKYYLYLGNNFYGEKTKESPDRRPKSFRGGISKKSVLGIFWSQAKHNADESRHVHNAYYVRPTPVIPVCVLNAGLLRVRLASLWSSEGLSCRTRLDGRLRGWLGRAHQVGEELIASRPASL